MKAKEVMEKLNITRPTLCSYVKKGYIHAVELPNGQYDYDEASVNNFSKSISTIAIQPQNNDAIVDNNERKLELLLEMSKVTYSLCKWLHEINFMGSSKADKLAKLIAEYEQLK